MLYSPISKTLLYKTDAPLKILSVTSGSKRIGEYVAVPATLQNCQELRRQNLEVVPVLDVYNYDYPIQRGRSPQWQQLVTANFLVLHPRSFCLNDMGTMKTLSALWAADFLMMEAATRGEQFRALIVSPLSTLEDVWWDHIHKNMLGRRKCIILHGSARDRQRKLEKDVDFYIINPDGLKVGFPSRGSRKPIEGLAKDLSLRTDIKLIIFDEASVYRNANTPRHKAGREVSKTRPYVWAMTGTPTPKGPENAYGLKKLKDPDYPESFTNYKSRVMLQVSQFKWVPKWDAAEQAAKLLQPSIRIPIEACWQGPGSTKQQRSCLLSPEQDNAFKLLKRDAIIQMHNGAFVSAVNEAVLRMKLLQVVSGVVYDEHHKYHNLNPTPRVELVREIIDNCAQKIIIAAPLTGVLEYLYSELSEYERAIINGAVSLNDRREILLRFSDKANLLRVLIVDPSTTAHGLNSLTTASVVVWYTPTDNAEHYQQLIKRIDRPGQTVHTTIVQIAATPIEKEIYTRLDNAQSMQGVVLQLAREG